MRRSTVDGVSDALAWLRAVLDRNGEIGASDLADHVSPGFLAAAGDLAGGLVTVAAQTGKVAEFEVSTHGDRGASVAVVGERSAQLVNLIVEAAAPYRIESLFIVGVDVAGRFNRPVVDEHAIGDIAHERLDPWIRRLWSELSLVGVAGAAVQDGETVWTSALGWADTVHGRLVDSHTPFRLGSVSKPVAALGLLRLMEEGAVGLDDPVNDHLHAYKVRHAEASTPPVTVKHLLTHTTGRLGIGRPFYHQGSDEPPSLAETYGPTLWAASPPGAFAYDNHGFATVGQLIADITGEPFPEWMADNVFTPIGMLATSYRPLPEEALPFAVAGSQVLRIKPYEPIVQAAGSLRSSVDDAAKLLLALLPSPGSTSPILSADTLRQMFSAQIGSPSGQGYGLGLPIDGTWTTPLASHTGGGPGVVAIIALEPARRAGVMLVTNTDDPGTRPIHEAFRAEVRAALHQLS